LNDVRNKTVLKVQVKCRS